MVRVNISALRINHQLLHARQQKREEREKAKNGEQRKGKGSDNGFFKCMRGIACGRLPRILEGFEIRPAIKSAPGTGETRAREKSKESETNRTWTEISLNITFHTFPSPNFLLPSLDAFFKNLWMTVASYSFGLLRHAVPKFEVTGCGSGPVDGSIDKRDIEIGGN